MLILGEHQLKKTPCICWIIMLECTCDLSWNHKIEDDVSVSWLSAAAAIWVCFADSCWCCRGVEAGTAVSAAQWLILLHLRESSQKQIHHIAAVSPLSNCVCWCWCSSKAYLHSNSRVLKRHGRHWCYLNLISLHCFCDICIAQNGNSFKPQSKLWKSQKIWRPRPFCRVWQGCEEEGTRVWPTCRTNAQV